MLPEFYHYRAIYTFSTLQQQFQPQKDYEQILTAEMYFNLPNITDPMYIQ
jgi:hypothetical protein